MLVFANHDYGVTTTHIDDCANAACHFCNIWTFLMSLKLLAFPFNVFKLYETVLCTTMCALIVNV